MKFSHERIIVLTLSSLVFATAYSTLYSAHAQNTDVNYENVAKSAAYLEAKALMDAGDFETAINVLKIATSDGENTFENSELLVAAYQERIEQVGLFKKRSLAIKMREAMEHSLKLRPSSVQARKALIGFHLKAPGAVGGSKDKARELIKGFPGLSPAEGHVYEAIISRAEKNSIAAMEHLDKALKSDPQNVEALITKGNVQIEQKAYSDAIITFETCTGFHPDNMSCHYLIGKASHVGNIQTQKGITALGTFIDSDDENEALMAQAHYRLGEIYARSGETDEARKSYERSIAINGLKKAKSALAKLK